MAYENGAVIDGRYTIVDRLGQGAHGVVYRAEDRMLGSVVAVKCLHADIAAEPGFKTRMAREAKAMGALSGTSAAQVLGLGRTDDGGMYIAMELVEGRDLETYLRASEARGDRIAAPLLVDLMGPIVDTLEAAHAIGIIHRDLKPGNIMVLDKRGRGPVRLLDFGLAKDLKADPLTAEGMIAGSPGYMAPEVWRGKPDQLDHRIDVYSFGAVLFRALAGAPPFDPSQPIDKLLLAVLRGARPSLLALRPDLPFAADQWVYKVLAIKPDDRFQSVRALWASFLGVMDPLLGR
jgi:eukaryotic-like serine/threonine-protein kinase